MESVQQQILQVLMCLCQIISCVSFCCSNQNYFHFDNVCSQKSLWTNDPLYTFPHYFLYHKRFLQICLYIFATLCMLAVRNKLVKMLKGQWFLGCAKLIKKIEKWKKKKRFLDVVVKLQLWKRDCCNQMMIFFLTNSD